MNELLIERVCRRVIQEYMGISDDVSRYVEEAMDIIWQVFDGISWSFVRDDIMVKNINLTKDYDFFANTNLASLIDSFQIALFGYDRSKYTYEEYMDILSKLSIDDENKEKAVKMAYRPRSNSIVLSIPFPMDGFIDGKYKTFLRTTLYHEIEHAYQSNKVVGGMKISDAYTKSLKKTDWDSKESSAMRLLRYYIKRCYYALDPYEIDSKLHEIWYELRSGRVSRLEECKGYQFMKDAIEGYNWVKNDVIMSKDKFYNKERGIFAQTVKEELGLNAPSQWFKYCERGIKKYNSQFRRIMGRRWEEIGNPSLGSFKTYSQGEIPQRDMFMSRKNPSLWKRMLNRIRKMR